MSDTPNQPLADAAAARRGKAAAQRAAQQRSATRRKLALIGVAAAVVLAVLATIVVLGVQHTRNAASVAAGTAPGEVLAQLSVPADVLTAAGTTGVSAAPSPVAGADALVKDGKPEVVYVGANYCPFCAAQRWALIVALSRFGEFHSLATTASSPIDSFPNTPTFSFHGATYTSDYVSFTGVETATNEVRNGSYTPLETLTDAQSALLDKYDAAPYVPSPGAIPFLDFGGKYLMQGAGYSPQLLAGKTQAQIAGTLADPTSSLGQTIDGNANVLTATICSITDNKPTEVCSDPTIASIQEQLDGRR
jgi:hypothetical protein